jgi:exodeoxyribonuclease VII small subunit
MSEKTIEEMSYEEKESRLDDILDRLDRSETPMDQLAAEAKEAAQLIMSMQSTLKSTKEELSQVFAEMDNGKNTTASTSPDNPEGGG